MRVGFGMGVAALLIAGASLAQAKDDGHGHRQLGAHEHGRGSLHIAVEGNSLAIELEAPGADIVGFEHAARSEKQKAKLAAAKSKLADLSKIVALPPNAGCSMKSARVEHVLGDDKDDHGRGHVGKKARSAHSHDGKHGHDKKAEQDEGGEHSEFHATYELTCKAVEAITNVSLPYFDTFKRAEALEVVAIGSKGQHKFEATRARALLDLSKVR